MLKISLSYFLVSPWTKYITWAQEEKGRIQVVLVIKERRGGHSSHGSFGHSQGSCNSGGKNDYHKKNDILGHQRS